MDVSSLAGLAIYKVNSDGSLDGRWAHPQLQGKLGTEKVPANAAKTVEGIHAVHTYDPDGHEIYRGNLTIATEGETYVLTWLGTMTSSGDQVAFKGIGLLQAADVMVATYQKV